MSRTSIPDDAMMRSQQAVDLGRGKEDELEPGSDGALTKDVERMDGRQGITRNGRRFEGGETQQAMKKAAETAMQNRTVRRRG
jgi:hypothetical protein